jgi:3-oxoacyl-[acyl-carrier protein] reductase
MKDIDVVSGDVLDVALRLPRDLGPGLLESVYEAVLAGRLIATGYPVARQRPIDIEFEGLRFEAAFRIDLLVDDRLVVEIKSLERLLPVHAEQLLTYLRLTKTARRAAHKLRWRNPKRGRPPPRQQLPPLRVLCASARTNFLNLETKMFDLTGMTALVTGASGGIGSEIAKALAAQGARLAVSGSNADKLQAFRASLGGDHVALPCNLSDAAAVDALVPQAVEKLGKLDILVNNAGVTRDNLAMRMKDDEWDSVIRVNLEAAFRLMRAAAKPMMKARFGRMISVTSIVGVTGNPGQANYAASKAGLIGMSKSMAQELASRGITVNCVAPGFITSPMTDALPDAQKTALTTKIPAGRLGEGADIGAAIVYLASREAGYVTGQTVHVNGGMAMI